MITCLCIVDPNPPRAAVAHRANERQRLSLSLTHTLKFQGSINYSVHRSTICTADGKGNGLSRLSGYI